MKSVLLLLIAAALNAQQPPDGLAQGDRSWDKDGGRRPPPRGGPKGPPSPRPLDGKWWTNPAMAERVGLSEDQQRKIEEIFQQHRFKLIDLRAALEKEEAILEPLLAAEHPQESRVLAQIDRVAEARAELEKANSRMLYGFRTVLTSDQWRQLQSSDRGPGLHPPPAGPRPK